MPIALSKFFPFTSFICFMIGIICARYYQCFAIVLFGTGCGLLAALIAAHYKRQQLTSLTMIITMILLGWLWAISAAGPDVKKQWLNVPQAIELKVISLPQQQKTRNSFYATLLSINNEVVKRKVKVYDYSRQLSYLHTYYVQATLRQRTYNGHTVYTLWITSQTAVVTYPISVIERVSGLIQKSILRLFARGLPAQSANFLSSVVVGRKELFQTHRHIFANAGVAHLLAISGLHVALLSATLLFILTLCAVPLRLRLSLVAIMLLAYMVITGFSTATIRAVIMYATITIGILVRRKVVAINALGLAGLLIILVDPYTIFSIGFQLSFISVAALFVGSSLIQRQAAHNKIVNYSKQLLLASLFVWVAIMPVVSYYFGKIHIVGTLANVILIPLFSVILTLTIVFLIFGIIPIISQSIAVILTIIIKLFLTLTERISLFPYAYVHYQCPWWQLALYYVIMAGVLYIFSRNRQRPIYLTNP